MFRPQIQKTNILLVMAFFNLAMVYWAINSVEIEPLPDRYQIKMKAASEIMEDAVEELEKYVPNDKDRTLIEHIKKWFGVEPFGMWLLGTEELTEITSRNWNNYIWAKDFEFQDYGEDGCLDPLEDGKGGCKDYNPQDNNNDPNKDNKYSNDDYDSLLYSFNTLFKGGEFREKCPPSNDSTQWNGCYDKGEEEKKRTKKLSKLSTLNPDFSAIVVSALIDEELDSTSTAAISFTGSFPGANIAVLSACESLGIKTRVISSIGASRFGATNPEYSWLDMQDRLVKSKIININKSKYSYGGENDRADGLDGKYFSDIIDRLSIQNSLMIDTRTEVENIDDRMAFYGDEVDIFINVGGNVRSMGTHEIRDRVNSKYDGGLILGAEELKDFIEENIGIDLNYENTVLYEYLYNVEDQIPILNLNNIKGITDEYKLPYPHNKSKIDIGTTNQYFKEIGYNPNVVFFALIFSLLNVIGVGIYSFIEIKKRMYSSEPDSIL